MSIFGTPVTTLSDGFNGGPGTITGVANTSLGDLIAVCFYGRGFISSVVSCADSAGNTYVAAPPQTENVNNGGFFWFYCLAATRASATNTITVTFSIGFVNALFIADVPLSGACAFDTITLPLFNSTAQPLFSPPFNTESADELIFALETDSGGAPAITAGTGYTLTSAAGLAFQRDNAE